MDGPDGGTAAALRLDEAVPLGYALVDRLAKDLGLRALAIKGPVAVAQGVTAPHASLDVDVLVEPSGSRALCEALERLGWVMDGPSTVPSVLPRHASTLTHPTWPCQVDVHHRFPGLLAEPTATFDALWGRREQVTIAGVRLTCGDPTTNTLITGVNALRDDRRDVVDFVVARLRAGVGVEARTDLARLAAQVGAAQTLAPVLDAVDAPAVPLESEASAGELEAWLVRSATGRVGSAGWLLELARSRKRRWPAIVWRAVVLTEDEIVRRDPRAADGWRQLQRARLNRLGSGLVALPRAVRAVRAASGRRRALEARAGRPADPH